MQQNRHESEGRGKQCSNLHYLNTAGPTEERKYAGTGLIKPPHATRTTRGPDHYTLQ